MRWLALRFMASDILKIPHLAILPGYNCNFRCAHCGVIGERKSSLSKNEISLLSETINKCRFSSVSFVGGEPTLYISVINQVLAVMKDLGKTEISITTNGAFGESEASGYVVLSAFKKLDRVQLSYDRYHERFLPFENIQHVFKSCLELGIEFSVVLTIQSPMDLVLISKLRKAGEFPIGVQKVLPFGNAKKNRIDYAHPEFDKSVLASACPNRGKISYLCGRGFSLCDVLPFSGLPLKRREQCFFPTADALIKNGVTRRMYSSRFSALLRKSGIPVSSLLPRHSSPCVLCEAILLSRPTGAGKGR